MLTIDIFARNVILGYTDHYICYINRKYPDPKASLTAFVGGGGQLAVDANPRGRLQGCVLPIELPVGCAVNKPTRATSTTTVNDQIDIYYTLVAVQCMHTFIRRDHAARYQVVSCFIDSATQKTWQLHEATFRTIVSG